MLNICANKGQIRKNKEPIFLIKEIEKKNMLFSQFASSVFKMLDPKEQKMAAAFYSFKSTSFLSELNKDFQDTDAQLLNK